MRTVNSQPANVPQAISWREQPLLLVRKAVLSLLQGVFEESDPGHYHWDENPEESDILITDECPLDLDVVGKRPAITVVRGTFAWGKTSLDELMTRTTKNDQRKHTDLGSGTISLNCCSSVPLESEYIAWVAANHCWLLRRLVQKHTLIHEFGRGIQIGAPSPAGALVAGDPQGEWFATSVSIPYFMQLYGVVTPLNQQVVNKVEAMLRVRGSAQIGPTNVRGQAASDAPADVRAGVNVRPPTIRGRPIRSVAFEQHAKEF